MLFMNDSKGESYSYLQLIHWTNRGTLNVSTFQQQQDESHTASFPSPEWTS